jgi:hypothetical protein
MLGQYSEYGIEYISILMTVTTFFFALPILLFPLSWARLMRWTLPEETDLVVYFGRCLGAFILIIQILMLRAVTTGTGYTFTFDALFFVFSLMLVIHIYGAIKRVQPITETLEIGLWIILLVMNIAFYPATSITL